MNNSWGSHPSECNMFLVVGPGRCGTKSMARILTELGVRCSHENYTNTSRNTVFVTQMLDRFKVEDGRLPFGESGILWLWLVPALRLMHPALKVLCLHRPKEEVIASFLERQRTRKRRLLLNPSGPVREATREILADHWCRCEEAMWDIEEPVHHMNVKDISDDAMLRIALNFLGVEGDLPDKRVYNATGCSSD